MPTRFMVPVLTAVAIVVACWSPGGCSTQDAKQSTPVTTRSRGSPDASQDSEVVVFAAASTKNLVDELAARFASDRDVAITINPGPSSGLANQIVEGAPAHLFLSASLEWATAVDDAGLAADSKGLLTNGLVLITPAENPAGIQSPDDLLSDKVQHIALAGEKVPAGKYADQALLQLGLLDKLTAQGKIARGQDVRTALSYVERGEAEAGIVYATDARLAKNVKVVHEFDSALHDDITYVAVLLKSGADHPAAAAFYEFLASSEADAIYASHGFRRAGQRGGR